MYGYRTKHAILKDYVEKQEKGLIEGRKEGLRFTLPNFLEELNPRKKRIVLCCLMELMEGDEYFKTYKIEPSFVGMTKKGLSALGNRYFLRKQNKLVWKIIVSFLMTGSTLAIALVTTITLLRGDKEINKLRLELEKIRLKQSELQVSPNPNIPHLQNYHQPNTKDSVKLSVTPTK